MTRLACRVPSATRALSINAVGTPRGRWPSTRSRRGSAANSGIRPTCRARSVTKPTSFPTRGISRGQWPSTRSRRGSAANSGLLDGLVISLGNQAILPLRMRLPEEARPKAEEAYELARRHQRRRWPSNSSPSWRRLAGGGPIRFEIPVQQAPVPHIRTSATLSAGPILQGEVPDGRRSGGRGAARPARFIREALANTAESCLVTKHDHGVAVPRAAGQRAGYARINLRLCHKPGL